jgi:hypothetical protein
MSWEQAGVIYEAMLIIVLVSNEKWATRWMLGNIGLLIPFYGGALLAGLFSLTGYGAMGLRVLLLTFLVGANLWGSEWAKKLKLKKHMEKEDILLNRTCLRSSLLVLVGFLGLTLLFPEWTMGLLWAYGFALVAFLIAVDIHRKGWNTEALKRDEELEALKRAKELEKSRLEF